MWKRKTHFQNSKPSRLRARTYANSGDSFESNKIIFKWNLLAVNINFKSVLLIQVATTCDLVSFYNYLCWEWKGYEYKIRSKNICYL